MGRKAKIKKPKINKKQLLAKFVNIPPAQKREFFMREFKLLNDLEEKYSLDFLLALSLPKKYDSMAIILCDSFKKHLDKKFRDFNYKIDMSKYEKIILNSEKSGEDLTVNIKLKTIKDFLNG